MTPSTGIESRVFAEILTPKATFPSTFDPSAGTGKLPALRAVVDGLAALVTPGLYPAPKSTLQILRKDGSFAGSLCFLTLPTLGSTRCF